MTELTGVLKTEHKAAEKCNICLKKFNDDDKKKVWDQCHSAYEHQGEARSSCNLKLPPEHAPIVFHSLIGYDVHLSIKELGKKLNRYNIGVITENKEKYISLNIKISIKPVAVTTKGGKRVSNSCIYYI